MVDYVENLIKKYVTKNIKIGKTNGITIAEKMQKSNPNLRVIFMTAYTEYSEEIFRVIPTYLLLKPIQRRKV